MLKEKIQADTTDSLKKGNAAVTEVLRMTLAAINAKEKEKKYKASKEGVLLNIDIQLTEEEIITVVSSEIKKRKDAITLYEKGNRPELAAKEKKEIEVLQNYLPLQLSLEELKKLVEESITKVGAKEMKDMGKVMADIMPKVKGKADNSEISKLIKEILTK